MLGVIVVAALAAYHLANLEDTFGNSLDLLPQWTLARLAVRGHRAGSYDFEAQSALIRSEVPIHKTEFLNSTHIRDIGVSPYPPPMVVLYAPLGSFSYDAAAKIVYLATLLLAFIAAGAIAGATANRIGFLAAAAAILAYPGFTYTLLLGQNSVLTLALLALGWCGLVRRWDAAAGIAWGLLLYKPHWYFAVLWLPILLGRWRVVSVMVLTAGWLAALATWWLGVESWRRWLDQVQALDAVIATDSAFRTWFLGMACDLRHMAYRYLPGTPSAKLIGWASLAVVGIIGIAATWRALRRPIEPLSDEPAGPCWLATACLVIPYRYYYDETVVLLPLLVAWSHRRRLRAWQLVLLAAVTVGYYVALPVMMYRDPGPFLPRDPNLPAWMQAKPAGWLAGPPWATLAVGGLWLLTLTFGHAPEKRAT
jgi:hypothetical protein